MSVVEAMTKDWLKLRCNKPKKLTILIDMDDTIENLTDVWVEFINIEYGMHINSNTIRTWDVEKVFPGLKRNQIFAQLSKPELWERVRPLPGAVEAIKKLINDGHYVYIVTASHPKTIKIKMEKFFFKYFPFIEWSHVIISSNKQMIKGDIMIDDAPHNLIGGEYYKILKTAHHNRDYNAKAHGMHRHDTWESIYDEINKISKGGIRWL